MSDDNQLGGGSLPATDDDEVNDSDDGDLLAGGARAWILAEAAGRVILAHVNNQGNLKIQINTKYANLKGNTKIMKRFQVANKANKKMRRSLSRDLKSK